MQERCAGGRECRPGPPVMMRAEQYVHRLNPAG
jgi:hypothetical protein